VTERSCVVESPVGALRIVVGEAGLREIRFVEQRADGSIDAACAGVAAQLAEYFAGHRRSFDLPLDLRGTPFQLRAWTALCEIPFGTTQSYAEQARAIGSPRAFRAVGSANGANPVPIVVPCHRVVASGGSLGGYSAGLPIKRALLAIEGVSVAG
jgi:O-6-methylguanine DNA methyltransferase